MVSLGINSKEELQKIAEGSLWRGLNKLTTKEKLGYLTGITFAEKRYIVKMLKDSPNFSKDLEFIKALYPELYYYLNWDNLLLEHIEPWILDYFRNYNISKLITRGSLKSLAGFKIM